MSAQSTISPPAAIAKAAIMHARKGGSPIAALTAYDYPMARLLDESGIDVLLVGDSLGMVVLGHADTTSVTLAAMEHHTRAVRRGTTNALLVADLPIGTYDNPTQTITSARVLIEAGADAVKLEGGRAILPQIEALRALAIPVVGHLGMLPQKIREEGRYSKKGKTPIEADGIIADALALDTLGVSLLVLESMVEEVASTVTRSVSCPTIGIGAGTGTDGQIRVIHDLLGTFPWFRPAFAECYHDGAASIRDAAARYRSNLISSPPSAIP